MWREPAPDPRYQLDMPQWLKDTHGWITVGCIAERHYLCQGGQLCQVHRWHVCHCPCHSRQRRLPGF